ncbi:MAG: hypothetical protein GXP27_22700 [Planctomycetes bacterium]|nr:hypothetical protein [Planctomycetota bacterium]
MGPSYTCPGERYPISRSVHLARLAAFYPKCRECAHRSDSGQLPQHTLERLQSTERRAERRDLWSEEGIRGVYLNELTRYGAGRYAACLAAELWAAAPLTGRLPDDPTPRARPKRQGPTVVVGRDERPSSPDIVIGVVASLRRMGCQVVDVGVTTKPCFCFAVDHLQAAAGIYVTGAGCEPAWTGCDFVGRSGQPFCQGGRLDQLAARFQSGFGRPTRSAGSYQTFQAHLPYEAALWKHFHDIRPVRVACACSSRILRDVLTRLFAKIPCQLELMPTAGWPTGRRVDDTDGELTRLAQFLRHTSADLGLRIHDDCMRCDVLDERGRRLPLERITALLTTVFLAEVGAARVVLASRYGETWAADVGALGGQVLEGGSTAEDVWQAVRDHEAQFGLDSAGRFWFNEASPLSDAVLLLGRILDAVTRGDARSLSEQVQRLPLGSPSTHAAAADSTQLTEKGPRDRAA